jgi:7-cyano-7-deazaguanine synthase in queuosine biosynthesis
MDFVSGDFWDIEFVPDKKRLSHCSRLLPDPDEGRLPLVCLYSGGLDSVAGMAARLAAEPGRPVIPVTVWHQPRQRYDVQKQLECFRARFSAVIDPLIVKVAMLWSGELDRNLEERSQRCRSFLFAALGGIAAIMHGQQVVEVFESGVGAINLPLMAGMTGAKNTKSTHPKFLRVMSRLATLIAERDVEFTLPFYAQTKGELVRSLRGNGLEELANKSASCVHFPQRHGKHKQCGVCPACIFRRQALATAGITEPHGAYEYDFLGPVRAANKIPPKRIQFLKAFLMQVAWLQDIQIRDQLPTAFVRHLISTETLRRDQSQEEVVELLTRCRNEWMAIASERGGFGHHWARLLACHETTTVGVTQASA